MSLCVEISLVRFRAWWDAILAPRRGPCHITSRSSSFTFMKVQQKRHISISRICSYHILIMSLPFLRPGALPKPSTIRYFLGTPRVLTTTTTQTFSTVTIPTSSLLSSSSQPVKSQSQKPYRINLTPSQQYPIYTLSKRGGNKKLTRIRRIEGDVTALRSELQEALGLEAKEVVINQLTGHIIVKVRCG
jgi:large subunit ribosomal protein L49